MRVALAWGLISLAFAACSGRRLPPGTPPPEYEPPIVTPWPERSDAGGADAAAPAQSDRVDPPKPPDPEAELSLDAGPR